MSKHLAKSVISERLRAVVSIAGNINPIIGIESIVGAVWACLEPIVVVIWAGAVSIAKHSPCSAGINVARNLVADLCHDSRYVATCECCLVSVAIRDRIEPVIVPIEIGRAHV